MYHYIIPLMFVVIITITYTKKSSNRRFPIEIVYCIQLLLPTIKFTFITLTFSMTRYNRTPAQQAPCRFLNLRYIQVRHKRLTYMRNVLNVDKSR